MIKTEIFLFLSDPSLLGKGNCSSEFSYPRIISEIWGGFWNKGGERGGFDIFKELRVTQKFQKRYVLTIFDL